MDFKYGSGTCRIDVPDRAKILDVKEPEIRTDPARFQKQVLQLLHGMGPISGNVAVVVADKTRRCGYETYLPVLTDTLEAHGVSRDQITFFIAYGTHSPQSREACVDIYGSVYDQFNFVHHDCRDRSLFKDCGRTRAGGRMHIRKDILESDLVITFGAVSHHYFAGYGGGRKLLFPGLGFYPDIYENHRLFLDSTERCLHRACRPGNLDHNPLAEDLDERDGFLTPPRISIHGILNSNSEVAELLAGSGRGLFLSACEKLDRYYKIRNRKLYDLVVASCGGLPKDINLIQVHKGIHNAAMFVKDGGTLVMLAQCRDQVGSDLFLDYFKYPDFGSAFDAIHENYKGNGGTALAMMSKTTRINIFIKTQLDDTICSLTGMEKIEKDKIEKMIQCPGRIAVIRNAGLLIC